jgi:N utilization substance protein A
VILIDLTRATGILRPEDQTPGERYNSGSRMKFYVRSVMLTSKGPEILLSRTDAALVRCLFQNEIPEVADGAVDIKGMAREPGGRTKVAVATTDDSIDPIGACIGQRGTRIQTIIAELGGEKIDIIQWSEDAHEYVANALSPARVSSVEIKESRDAGEEKLAIVTVPDDQLSLAVGKGGQNVRLASRLVSMRITVQGETGGKADVEEPAPEEAHLPPEAPVEEPTAKTENA